MSPEVRVKFNVSNGENFWFQERKRGRVGYCIGRLLTGHGRSLRYLHGFEKLKSYI